MKKTRYILTVICILVLTTVIAVIVAGCKNPTPEEQYEDYRSDIWVENPEGVEAFNELCSEALTSEGVKVKSLFSRIAPTLPEPVEVVVLTADSVEIIPVKSKIKYFGALQSALIRAEGRISISEEFAMETGKIGAASLSVQEFLECCKVAYDADSNELILSYDY